MHFLFFSQNRSQNRYFLEAKQSNYGKKKYRGWRGRFQRFGLLGQRASVSMDRGGVAGNPQQIKAWGEKDPGKGLMQGEALPHGKQEKFSSGTIYSSHALGPVGRRQSGAAPALHGPHVGLLPWPKAGKEPAFWKCELWVRPEARKARAAFQN